MCRLEKARCSSAVEPVPAGHVLIPIQADEKAGICWGKTSLQENPSKSTKAAQAYLPYLNPDGPQGSMPADGVRQGPGCAGRDLLQIQATTDGS